MPFIRFNGKNILFVHIPKTGGSTIEMWMEKHGELQFRSKHVYPCSRCSPQHFMANDVLNMFSKDHFDFIFTVVRNPYERLESEYRWRLMANKEEDFPCFESWLSKVLQNYQDDPWIFDNHLRPQYEFATAGMHTYRFESGFEFIMKSISSQTGLPVTDEFEVKLKDSSEYTGTISWSPPLHKAVNALYAKDFEWFRYTMNMEE